MKRLTWLIAFASESLRKRRNFERQVGGFDDPNDFELLSRLNDDGVLNRDDVGDDGEDDDVGNVGDDGDASDVSDGSCVGEEIGVGGVGVVDAL